MFDTLLKGTWKLKGAAAPYRTYRVDDHGRYFFASPAAPFTFVDAGQAFEWGGLRHSLKLGTPNNLVGVWDADAGGEEIHFRADGSATIHWSSTEEYFGNYELQNGDTELWYEEFRSVISTTGSIITFDPPYAQNQQYLYSVSATNWDLTDPATGNLVVEYEKV